MRGKEWREANKEKVREYAAVYRAANKEKAKEYAKAYYESNKARWAALPQYRFVNPEGAKAAQKRYRHANRHMTRAGWQKRYAAKLLRTPPWLGEFDDLVFIEASHLARLRRVATGIEWDVHHVLPLQAEKVSGLHVWNNIAVIPAWLNRSIANDYEPS